jgi:hypothetical protein
MSEAHVYRSDGCPPVKPARCTYPSCDFEDGYLHQDHSPTAWQWACCKVARTSNNVERCQDIAHHKTKSKVYIQPSWTIASNHFSTGHGSSLSKLSLPVSGQERDPARQWTGPRHQREITQQLPGRMRHRKYTCISESTQSELTDEAER